MNKAKRRVVIAGNWKMNKNRAEAKALITELLPLVMKAAWTYRFSPALEGGSAVTAQFVYVFTPET